ncbi:small acid-soluble spore protein H (minor) [Paenibacillus phyllosphaerae]|uniref:Small acid-soluble spore protein H (Minor) n=1 Tax=Paenibacillus phyllosphaerae TaxID=274593 RepID=A0A7W5B0C3_9BACL|nr:H-type small acid-soluble spore protein [Paenibacillus phyllosphaerae]MBB3112072.1 small acid-soluble spore protein H (minor) [Paenibacillus phyllosphaerae]
MNTERAIAILEAKETIPVQYDGKPVWIERVDERGGTATVTIESAAAPQVETVKVEQLVEG